MTKYIKTMKLQHRREMHARHFQGRQGLGQPLDDDWSRHQIAADDVDENLVGLLMGKRLRYDQHGHVIDDILPDEKQSKAYTQRDLEIFGTQRDLYWWFCKQDVYQSMLGGGRLFMDYKLWSHCLPRSPVGRLNATYDHVILLLGRLANFASKDLKRKRLAMKVNGSWRPPGEMRIPPQGTGQSQSSHQGPPNFPQVMGFAALIPNIDEPKLPMGFSSTRESPPQSASSDERDLETWTLEAEDEWQDIRNAFNILEHHFGEDFQALGPEFSTPYETPFGAALQYRTYGIAGIWMNYYIGLIACHRAHPSMPPASINASRLRSMPFASLFSSRHSSYDRLTTIIAMAAGLAARQTASYANEIGRIAAGIAPDCSMTTEVNPGVGAALIESSTCLFVAGIQYQNAAQRSWSVNRLRDIGRLTGWQTAFAIATGLETSWIKVFELGKGPPYTRTGEERKIPADWCQGRRVDKVLAGRYKSEGRLVVHRADRIHYALGVLGVEEDFEHLDLDNDEPNET
ncbi:hypothetical protein B7494_g8441 [Chlorociboria aeruginascens]|nr:hypothetical protein B7494_g8441 [Chlorociboria aeruginascens]